MKKVLSVMMVFFILLNLTGCEPLRKKFTRKKKPTVKMPKIHQVKKYLKTPSPELYKKHYVYWSSFNSELERCLGQSHKKDMVCIEHIVSNLRDMENILVPEKAAELKKHTDRLAVVQDTIRTQEISQFNRDSIKSTLGREGRFIRREFCYDKVKNYLKKNFEATEEPGLVAAPMQGQALPASDAVPALRVSDEGR